MADRLDPEGMTHEALVAEVRDVRGRAAELDAWVAKATQLEARARQLVAQVEELKARIAEVRGRYDGR